MGLAERAELVARLSLKDDFSRPLSGVQKQLGGFSRKLKALGTGVAVGVGAAVAIGAGIVTKNIQSGIASLATLEDATTSLDGAIKQVGKGWTITGAQIAAESVKIESAVQSAFDDKDIAQATTTLIRYGGVTQEQLPKAMQVMTDLAARTGDVGSASSALAKAMADPTKATRLLRTAGVSLDKAQQKQIKTWVESGQKAKAQAFLLQLVEDKVKGAAAAMHGPFRDSQLVLRDAVEEAQKALAIGFLPVLEEVRKELTTFLSKKENIQKIKDFGQGLADGFRDVVKWVKQIPWDQVAGAVGGIADFAKGIASAFMSLPTEAKSMILGLAALNKLSGGGVITVGVDLLGGGVSALFQQFLGRGSIANPMVVVPVGGGLGGAPGVVPAGGGWTGLLKTVIVGAVVVEGLKAWMDSFAPFVAKNNELGASGLTPGEIEAQKYYTADAATQQAIFKHLGRIQSREEWLTGNAKLSGAEPPGRGNLSGSSTTATPRAMSPDERQEANDTQRKLDALKAAATATIAGVSQAKIAQISAIDRDRSAVVAAIQNNRPIVNVHINLANNTTVYRSGSVLNTTKVRLIEKLI